MSDFLPMRRLDTRVRAENPRWKYLIDRFVAGDLEDEYHYVHAPGATMIAPFDDEGNLVMIEQYRYLTESTSLEFPCGGVEDGLTPEENALKELREETGYQGDLEFVGEYYPYIGAADERCFFYAARNLEAAPLPLDATEQIRTKRMSIEEARRAVESGAVIDGLTLACWTLLQPTLRSMK
ncbi:MAG: NUDIX domain-containing protein [Ignavibacteriales bacterium]|jgi:ADP-ribose pyrophosphatase|nr:NUDIX domain-containing protein [Ignavibacteriales bacterium]